MRFFRTLCCGAGRSHPDPAPRPADSIGERPHVNEKCDPNPKTANLPTKPSKFIAHLNQHETTRTEHLLQPYLEYELWLRKAFARGTSTIDGMANLVPVYGKQQPAIRIQNLDRRGGDSSQYLMRLPDKSVRTEGSPATAETLNDFRTNFDAFTHGILKDLGEYFGTFLIVSEVLIWMKTGQMRLLLVLRRCCPFYLVETM